MRNVHVWGPRAVRASYHQLYWIYFVTFHCYPYFAEFMRNIYTSLLIYYPFPNIAMSHIFVVDPRLGKRCIYHTQSILWLLMACRRKGPRHWHQWHWPIPPWICTIRKCEAAVFGTHTCNVDYNGSYEYYSVKHVLSHRIHSTSCTRWISCKFLEATI